MSEADAIAAVDRPATRASLAADLASLGVERGMTLMVHSSLSRLGFVAGGAQAVVLALLDAVGPDGTLMMPTHSTGNSEPSWWSNPPIPESWWGTVRETMPAYDPAITPTRGMGAIVECFRRLPDVTRSAHPSMSAAAIGPNAATLVGDHPLDHGLGGTGSPQGRLYELDGHILLLGVTHANNTSLHVAEYQSPPPGGYETLTHGAAAVVDGERHWVTFDSYPDDESDFEALGDAFAETRLERRGPVGAGTGRLMRSRDIIDFGAGWLKTHRHGA